jgi:hypothetical protein
VGARVRDTCSSSGIRVLIDGSLHLLEELVNIQKIILSPQVGHGRQSVLMLQRGTMNTALVTTN